MVRSGRSLNAIAAQFGIARGSIVNRLSKTTSTAVGASPV
jgi:hypothetical protein